MKVHELRAALAALPDDAEVYVSDVGPHRVDRPLREVLARRPTPKFPDAHSFVLVPR